MSTDAVPRLPLPRPSPLQPAEGLARLRRDAALVRVTAPTGEPAWLVTRYDQARAVLADARFRVALSGADSGADGSSESNDSLFQDPPGHTRLRRLVSAAFTARRIVVLRTRAEVIANRLVDHMLTQRPPVDLMEVLAHPLPITVIGELLGVPASERDGFRVWSSALLSMPGSSGGPEAAWGRLTAQISALIDHKRQRGGHDLLSALIAVRDTDTDRLTDAELVTMAVTIITAGYITTSIGIALGTILLTEHRQLHRLTHEPAAAPAVEEILRYQAVAGDVARIASQNLEVSGTRIKAGERVLISVTSANRDERRFRNADHFDIAREDNPHLTFGHGVHHCLGAALARLELQAVLATLAARLPDLHLAVEPSNLTWQRSALFGDEFPTAVLVSW